MAVDSSNVTMKRVQTTAVANSAQKEGVAERYTGTFILHSHCCCGGKPSKFRACLMYFLPVYPRSSARPDVFVFILP